MKTCCNCKFWEKEKYKSKDWCTADGVDARPCDFMPDSTQDMTNSGCAIQCSHDGPVYVGRNFGCIHFESKE